VTERPVDLHGEAGETWGRGLRFGLVPLRDDRVYWFAVLTLPEGAPLPGDGPDDRARLLRVFGSWHAPIAEVIAATSAGAVVRSAVHDLASPVRSFVDDRVALLGDAAHAMTPDLGQGANQALEDAATLVALLRSPDGGTVGAEVVPRALEAYDRLRRPRSQQVAARARRVGALAQAGTPVGATARDILLRLVPDRLLSRSLLTLQDWQPPGPLGQEPSRRVTAPAASPRR
jgi:2-polyprenyl-6-methoxyphenol hydroxylase-like FAD-dependent oxidoreductase